MQNEEASHSSPALPGFPAGTPREAELEFLLVLWLLQPAPGH